MCIYGIPLHVWNANFFKLCVLDCGRFLRVDNSTIARERFDYARVLLATSSLEVINKTDKLLVDGVMVELKIIKELSFSIGEDVCLLEDDDVASKVSHLDINIDHEAPDTREHITELVNHLAGDWAAEEKASQHHSTPIDKVALMEVDNIHKEPMVCNSGRDMLSHVVEEVDVMQ